jgi:acyl-CoA reductase-like NAD-dependent aldehyde dehydrogenase
MSIRATAPPYTMTIGGRQVAGPAHRDILNPADGSLVGQCPIGTSTCLQDAIHAAAAAQPAWWARSGAERRAACEAIARILTENARELAELVTREQGKPLKGLGSEFELGGCAAWAGYTAALDLPPKTIEASPGKRIELHREPVGVVGSITPWNWPLLIAIWHIVPALRTGNTVVIKPSPFTPLGTLRMVELLQDALPPGVLNAVAGDDALGAEISGHPMIGKVVFTGSAATGRKVMANAAPTLKHLTLELGGNDPGIVLQNANVEKIVEPLFWGAFINSGQTCAALKRLYVHDGVYERLCAALVEYARAVRMGNGMREDTRLGPLQNARQLEKVIDLVEDAKRRGGKVLLGGEQPNGPGYFYPVTLIGEVSNGVRLVDEEQFGPVLPIVRYHEVEEAVGLANASDYGLAASVWGADLDHAHCIARRLQAGTVYINKHADVAPNVPFGGIKSSGLGVEFGEEGLQAYTQIKVINAVG